ncbi:DotI/IcmL family type IV secretion protein [Legionella bononiensis]|uniref:DotI/IcmL family type IV secretion protein n=1 Tax=Legionella bononiensis TaxID=2793102 RepID=A0ABS1W705_9GAMM|nr:DotI/IcmL family type IV secretion protein [Legionella bononiensis]MBL7525130.1 DotI/IcmL family type IV secretion protein [Legionella bononiensis]MBL7562855.1 DotI/IcmL family type IV secretion protein [Legionella bononiensis]
MRKIVLFGALFLLIDTQGLAEQATAHTPKKPLVNNQNTFINPKVQTEYCNYKIPVDTTHIDPAVILKWAEHAVIQSFQFTPAELESQLHALKSCYTDKGWIGFHSALQKSGNLKAIQTQNLSVNSRIDGTIQLIDAQENQWKILVPIKVIYQNEQDSVTHFLTVYLTVTWRNTDGLGIMQMISTPHSPPIANKSRSLEETAQYVYSLMTRHGMDTIEGIQKSSSTFIASLFPITSKTREPHADSVTSQAELTQNAHAPNEAQHVSLTTKIQSFANQQLTPNQSTAANTIHLLESDINCDGTIQETASKIDPDYVLIWAKHAITQSFNFNSPSLDSQLQKLQSCYTEQGWLEFSTALQKSGNLEAMRSLNIKMSSEPVGSPQLILSKDEQWVITLPIKVAYQNNQSTISQLLDIKLTIGRKNTGDLGIIHMLATINGASKPEATQ